MVRPRTHTEIETELCGAPLEVGRDRAVVELCATEVMRVDGPGLVHGGFVFGLADHAAMLAVDEPTVVLASAECRFLAPVEVGDRLVAQARVDGDPGDRDPRRPIVRCTVHRDEIAVFEGTFHCAVPRTHVLARGSEDPVP